jgi:hypothetical protein
MFFYKLENMEVRWDYERDSYLQMPDFEFNYTDPELIGIIKNIVDESVTNIIEGDMFEHIEENVFNMIHEVFETKVLAADTAHVLNAWIRYLCVDMLETNFEALDPRLPAPSNMQRYFVRIQGITIQHIVSTLGSDQENYVTPFGDQIYWTAVDEHPQAYKYFTITDPISVHPNRVLVNPLPPDMEPPEGYEPVYRELTEEEKEGIRERFRVKVRETLNTSVRKSDAFENIGTPDGSGFVMIPKVTWGSGDHNGLGRGYQYKDLDSFNTTYTTRAGHGKTAAGTEIGIRLQDDGCYYWDIVEAEWKLIGSGGSILEDGKLPKEIEDVVKALIATVGNGHIILDKLPTDSQIQTFPNGSEVLVYDPTKPFVPAS